MLCIRAQVRGAGAAEHGAPVQWAGVLVVVQESPPPDQYFSWAGQLCLPVRCLQEKGDIDAPLQT